MIKLIRFYLKNIGLILPALLIGSVVINGIALILTWLSKKPAIYISLPLTTGVLIISLLIIGIRINLKDLNVNSFTIAGMLPASQLKILGAKFLTGCGIILLGIIMQMILAVSFVSISGHPEVFNLFGDSVTIVHEKEGDNGKKAVRIIETGKDGKVIQEMNIQTEKGIERGESHIRISSAEEDNGTVASVSIGGNIGNVRTDTIGVHGDEGEMFMNINGNEAKMAGLFGILAVPMLFSMIVCFVIYPFVWARYFTKKEFLGKVLAVVFIGLMFIGQGMVTDSTGYLLGVSAEAAHYGPDWISFCWNIAICATSYLFTAWFREKKMDLL